MRTLADRLRPLRNLPDEQLVGMSGVLALEERDRRNVERAGQDLAPLPEPPARAARQLTADPWLAMSLSGQRAIAEDFRLPSREALAQLETARERAGAAERRIAASAASDQAQQAAEVRQQLRAGHRVQVSGRAISEGPWERMVRLSQEEQSLLVVSEGDRRFDNPASDPDSRERELEQLGGQGLGTAPRGR